MWKEGLSSSSLRGCARNAIYARAQLAKPKLDGRSAEPASAHANHSWPPSVGIQVSLQHLPARTQEPQHAVAVERASVASADPTLAAAQPVNEEFERPAGNTSSAECAPSTSARGSAGGSKQPGGGVGAGRRVGDQGGGSNRDAAALTRRITLTKTTAELHDVVLRHKSQFNSIHTAAAIVKLAKLTAGETEQPHHQHHQHHHHGHKHSPRGQAQPLSQDAVANGHPSVATAGTAGGGAAGWRQGSSGLEGSSRESLAPGPPTEGGQGPLFRSRHRGSRRARATDGADARLRDSLLDELSEAFLEHAQQQQYPSARHFANVVWALGSMRIRSLRQLPDATRTASSPLASSSQVQSQHHTSSSIPTAAATEAAAAAVPAEAAPASSELPAQPAVLQLGPLLSVTAAQLLSGNGSRLSAALPQELSNLALGLAKLGYREVPLWAAIIAAGKARLPAFKPQELHNLAWAVAAASQDRSMISAAVQAALPQLGAFSPSGLANLLWACATAQCHVEELFDGAAAALLRLPPAALNSQDVANTAWAFAKVQHPHPALMRHLGDLVLWAAAAGPRDAAAAEPAAAVESAAAEAGSEQTVEAGPGRGAGAEESGTGRGLRVVATQELVNLLWAFASMPPQGLGLPDSGPGGAAAVGRSASVQGNNRASQSSSSSSSSTSASSNYGSSNSSSGGAGLTTQLLAALLPEVVRRRDLTPQGASNALWAAGRLQPCAVPPAALAAALRAAAARAGSMSDQELANALWAAGELRGAGHYVPPEAVAPLFAAACCPSRLAAAPDAAVAQLLSAAVKLRLVGSPHMDALAKRVMRGLGSLGPQELCVLAAAVAEAVHVAAYCNPILLNGLANAAVAQVDRLDPQGLSTLLWAFARAGKHYHGPLTTTICRVAAPRLREFSDLELSNLVWALAVLKCQDRQLLVRAARVLVARVRLRRQRQQAAAAGAAGLAAMQQQRRYWSGQLAGGAGLPQQQQQQQQQVQIQADAQRRLGMGSSLGQGQGPGQEAPNVSGWRRAGSDGGVNAAAQPHAAEPSSGIAARSSGGNGAGAGATGGPGGIPSGSAFVSTATAGSATSSMDDGSLPDDRPLLRRLPSLHHYHDETHVMLQARRPHPRDAAAAAAAAAGGAAAGAASGATAGGRGLLSCDGSDVPAAVPTVRRRRLTDSLSDGEDSEGASAGLGAGGAAPTAQGHAKSMAKLLWGFAKCNLYNQALYRLLVQELRPLMHLLTPHEVVQVLWSVAYHSHACPELLDAAAPAIASRLGRFCPWDASVVAWAYAKLDHSHRDLFESLQHHALRFGGRYKEPSLLRLAWACSQLQLHVREPLLAQLHALRTGRPRAASSYDGADGEPPPPSDAGRTEPEWW
ncbi:hypothetical protein HYH02_008788 [Chlamydomonas schloesseri]|uniref:FAST kinase leucine-rich domain-containing protein n=1 Tax=Chlamydomonas schloesseri TaxID=2026947 RepID=A0A835WDC6_9CHLO|nr:hypothetical protein HYH02_008788 [Chlamydomonas schloesseri]|eukprot:KAG2445322.1 hypothetical protein HYH02_008788 [Chlamydomonas schloesseri]